MQRKFNQSQSSAGRLSVLYKDILQTDSQGLSEALGVSERLLGVTARPARGEDGQEGGYGGGRGRDGDCCHVW